MKEKSGKIFLLFFFIILKISSNDLFEIQRILKNQYQIKEEKNCNYKYIEKSKIKFQNDCKIQIKDSLIEFKFKIYSDQFDNLVLFKKNSNLIEVSLKDLKKNQKFQLVRDEILSTKDRKIYYYFDNNVKKIIQVNFIPKEKIILILEYGKFEIFFRN